MERLPRTAHSLVTILCQLPAARMVDISERISMNPNNGHTVVHTNVTGGTDKHTICDHCNHEHSKYVHVVASWRNGRFTGMVVNSRKYDSLAKGIDAMEQKVNELHS